MTETERDGDRVTGRSRLSLFAAAASPPTVTPLANLFRFGTFLFLFIYFYFISSFYILHLTCILCYPLACFSFYFLNQIFLHVSRTRFVHFYLNFSFANFPSFNSGKFFSFGKLGYLNRTHEL